MRSASVDRRLAPAPWKGTGWAFFRGIIVCVQIWYQMSIDLDEWSLLSSTTTTTTSFQRETTTTTTSFKKSHFPISILVTKIWCQSCTRFFNPYGTGWKRSLFFHTGKIRVRVISIRVHRIRVAIRVVWSFEGFVCLFACRKLLPVISHQSHMVPLGPWSYQ